MAEQRRIFAWTEINARELQGIIRGFSKEHGDPGAYMQVLLELRRWLG